MALSLPSLPTDNLYKFVALSGVALIIFANYLTFSQLWSFQGHITDAEESIKMISAHHDVALEKKEKWKQLAFESKVRTVEGKLDSKSDEETKAAEERLMQAEDDLAVEMVKLSFATKRVANEWRWLTAGIVICFFAVTAGLWMARWGFRNWYLRIQLPMDAQVTKNWKIDGATKEAKTDAGDGGGENDG
jgi:hypothetical protein